MDLVGQWVAGWAASRGLTYQTSPLLRVQVGDERREIEYVGGPGADVEALVGAVSGDPRAMLTLVGVTLVAPPPLRLVNDEEVLMSTRLRPLDAPPSGLRMRTEASADRLTVRLYDGGTLAASGQAGLVVGSGAGDVVVPDRIGTTEAYRGRGLARELMAVLTEAALERGATEGLLVASAMGRGLYERLGWEGRAPVLGFTGA